MRGLHLFCKGKMYLDYQQLNKITLESNVDIGFQINSGVENEEYFMVL